MRKVYRRDGTTGGGVLIDPWPVDSYTYDDGTYVGGYT